MCKFKFVVGWMVYLKTSVQTFRRRRLPKSHSNIDRCVRESVRGTVITMYLNRIFKKLNRCRISQFEQWLSLKHSFVIKKSRLHTNSHVRYLLLAIRSIFIFNLVIFRQVFNNFTSMPVASRGIFNVWWSHILINQQLSIYLQEIIFFHSWFQLFMLVSTKGCFDML